MNTDPRRNSEGYSDPTAYEGLKKIIQEENALDKEATDLIKVLRYIISLSNFELINRIEIKDIRTGREFK